MRAKIQAILHRFQDPINTWAVPFVTQHAGHGHDFLWWAMAPLVFCLVCLIPSLRAKLRHHHHHCPNRPPEPESPIISLPPRDGYRH